MEPDPAGRTVFLFPGPGARWRETAAELLGSAPAFDEQMRRCDVAFGEFNDWSLLGALRGGDCSCTLDRVDVVQPLLFAVSVSLAAHWRALGIVPDAVLGYSEGEMAAAYVAGALSLRDTAKLVTSRSKVIRTIAGTGGMASIALPLERVHALIEPWGRSISVAAQNGSSSTVVSGVALSVSDLMVVCERNGVPAERIPVDYASHSVEMDTLRDAMRDSLSGLQPRTAVIAFISGVTGAALDTSILDGDYWFANLRQPVLFNQAVRWSYEHGYRKFVGADRYPVLNACIEESIEECGDYSGAWPTRTRIVDGAR